MTEARQFAAPVLRATLRSLRDVHRFPVPAPLLDARDRLREIGAPMSAAEEATLARSAMQARLNSMLRGVRQSHKFVLGSDFVRVLMDTLERATPERLEQMLATARVPFDDAVWIEYPLLVRDDPDFDGCAFTSILIRRNDGRPRLGFNLPQNDVIEADADWEPGTRYTVDIFVYAAKSLDLDEQGESLLKAAGIGPADRMVRTPGLSISAMEFSLTAQHNAPLKHLIGRKLSGEAGKRLARHCRIVRGEMFGDAAQAIHDAATAADLDEAAKLANLILFQGTGFQDALHGWRGIICMLALMATHIGGNPVTQQTVHAVPQQFAAGRLLPKYEFRLIRLYRPMDAPTLLRRAFPARPRIEGMRWHQVIGSWHHRRAATNVCQLHPRSCPLADWVAEKDDDGNTVGAGQQRCAVCRRKRWFIPDHPRGDAKLGIVEAAYEVRASRSEVLR